ncbi:hypothetical protein EKG38_10440 [Shewanella canadensis]|uniref:Uncharacterized protein n=1 Tax=Shewanella canadensis TaxID=271096 RepID=A0A3S0LN02_9GAMM|nr:hypothetical protein EKG38_10440 [Shewanella canadensis]
MTWCAVTQASITRRRLKFCGGDSAAALNPKGILFLGASESIAGLTEEYEMVRCNPGSITRRRLNRETAQRAL